MRTTFLVGRLTPKSAEIVLTEGSRSPAPFPGPWTLRALVRPSSPCVDLGPLNAPIH